MKRVATLALGSALVAPLAFAAPGAPSVRGIQPVEYFENLTCSDLTGNPEAIEFKLDPPSSGEYTDGDITVTVNIYDSSLGRPFDWSATGGVIVGVFAKGGPGGNWYDYEGTGFSWDKKLHTPINETNERYYGNSHFSFCYLPGEPSIAVEKTCSAQDVDLNGSTTTSSVQVVNDGDFPLFNPTVEELIIGQSCAITSVDGNPTYVPLPDNTQVPIPGIPVLNVGQVVNMEVECFFPLAANVPNVIKARGNFFGFPVEDKDASDPDSECKVVPDPMIKIEKDCERTRLQQETGESGKPVLVVEACSSILVENTSAGAFFNVLETVIVTDPKIPELANGVDVGPLQPGEWVDVQQFLGLPNLCWQPAAPEQGQNNDPDGIKFDTTDASFGNTATVEAKTPYGDEAASSDPASCPLCDCPEGEDCPS